MNAMTTGESPVGRVGDQNPALPIPSAFGSVDRVPITRGLTLASACSLAIAALLLAVSAAGLLVGPAALYGVAANGALGVTASTAGILVPGVLAQDAFNVVVALPLLLASLWLTRRGSLVGLLLWPGVLFFVTYTYAIRLISAPFGILFLPDVALVVLSAYTAIGLVASIDARPPALRNRRAARRGCHRGAPGLRRAQLRAAGVLHPRGD